jgi:hypothetical protein
MPVYGWLQITVILAMFGIRVLTLVNVNMLMASSGL